MISQRVRSRDGLASRGSFCSAWVAAQRSSSLSFGSRMLSFSAARFLAYFATVRWRFFSRMIIDVLAI